jgi:hypothetical protein
MFERVTVSYQVAIGLGRNARTPHLAGERDDRAINRGAINAGTSP